MRVRFRAIQIEAKEMKAKNAFKMCRTYDDTITYETGSRAGCRSGLASERNGNALELVEYRPAHTTLNIPFGEKRVVLERRELDGVDRRDYEAEERELALKTLAWAHNCSVAEYVEIQTFLKQTGAVVLLLGGDRLVVGNGKFAVIGGNDTRELKLPHVVCRLSDVRRGTYQQIKLREER